jgi:hypothetical protein
MAYEGMGSDRKFLGLFTLMMSTFVAWIKEPHFLKVYVR